MFIVKGEKYTKLSTYSNREQEQRFFPLDWNGGFISYVLHYYDFISFKKETNLSLFQTLWCDSSVLALIAFKFL